MDPIPLTDQDRAILELESPTIAGHTAKVIWVDGPQPTLGELRARIAAGLAREPALTACLGGTEEDPAWGLDPQFEIAEHVADSGLSGLDEDGVRALVLELFKRRLDRARPLWRIDLAGLAGGGWVLVWRLHHALADGFTAMRFARELLWDHTARPTDPPGPPRPGDKRHWAHPGRFVARELAPTVRRSPFDGATGHQRALAWSVVPLEPLHRIGHRLCGATVNDLLLTLVAGGMRRWLLQQQRPLEKLRIRVPVSLHAAAADAANQDSFFLVPVNTAEADPVARLREVQKLEMARKLGRDAERLGWLTQRLRRLSPRLAAGMDDDPRAFAVAVSNVRGPAEEVRLLGARVRSLLTVAELGQRHGLRVAAASFNGTLSISFLAEPEIVPEVDQFAAGVDAEAQQLIAAG